MSSAATSASRATVPIIFCSNDAKPELLYTRLETIRQAADWIITSVEEELERYLG